jgi:hypothetical protein
LVDRAVIYAQKFGTHITVPGMATALHLGRVLRRATGRGNVGSRPRGADRDRRDRTGKLEAPRLAGFEATSIYYAATQFEAALRRNVPVVIVGGGNSAGRGELVARPPCGNRAFPLSAVMTWAATCRAIWPTRSNGTRVIIATTAQPPPRRRR